MKLVVEAGCSKTWFLGLRVFHDGSADSLCRGAWHAPWGGGRHAPLRGAFYAPPALADSPFSTRTSTMRSARNWVRAPARIADKRSDRRGAWHAPWGADAVRPYRANLLCSSGLS